jgi:glycosyltransferase involved in cell wall biosynthesis
VLNRVAVLVPVHDEEELLPGCLEALRAAGACRVFVVLDACTDRSAAIARRYGVEVLHIRARNVGVARHLGAVEALRAGARWLASTDADSRVPPDWLSRQLRHARDGADVVAGTVSVTDWTGWPPTLPERYAARYAAARKHVHGANLALSAGAYQRTGGFPALRVGEDRAIVDRAVQLGLHVRWAADLPVRTSARRTSRVEDGFAGYLRELA